MSSDKRRQARVQGAGWSASTNRGRAPMMTNTTANVTGRTCQPANTGAPSWLGKTVDQPKDNSKQFVYEEPEEVCLFVFWGLDAAFKHLRSYSDGDCI